MLNMAFVFPGQGSQSIGMLSDFLPQYPIVTDLFAEASDALGYDLWSLVQNGSEEKLNQTEYTQVAMLTADVAVYHVLMQEGIPQPQLMAGHSLGEYAALVCAHALTLRDAVQLVAQRGQVMQHAIPLGMGAMAALVGLTDEVVNDLCIKSSTAAEQVTPANYNAIGQVVIAGHTSAVERAIEAADKAGARLAKIIPVSVPCHCPLMADAAELFAESLSAAPFKSPAIDVISNVDLSIYNSPQHIRDQLKEQLYSPVRWVETIQYFKSKEINLIVECGPGKVLSGLTKRIERSISTISIYDTISLDQLVEQTNIPA
jgi:[acyl-carrier-protein] S-malonyltransferase